MSDMEQFLFSQNQTGSVHSFEISAAHKDLRLVKGHHVFYPASEKLGADSGIVRKPVGNIIVEPAAPQMKSVGKIPVIKSSVRLNAVFQQFVDKIAVKPDSRLIYFSRAAGHKPAPGN